MRSTELEAYCVVHIKEVVLEISVLTEMLWAKGGRKAREYKKKRSVNMFGCWAAGGRTALLTDQRRRRAEERDGERGRRGTGDSSVCRTINSYLS